MRRRPEGEGGDVVGGGGDVMPRSAQLAADARQTGGAETMPGIDVREEIVNCVVFGGLLFDCLHSFFNVLGLARHISFQKHK